MRTLSPNYENRIHSVCTSLASTGSRYAIESDRGREQLQGLVSRAVAINFAAGLLTTVVIVLLARTLLSHFGSEYVQAEPALLIVAATALLGMATRAAPLLLAYSDQEKALLNITIVEFATLLVPGFLLAPLYGMVGVALATFASVVVKAALATARVRKRFGLRPLAII